MPDPAPPCPPATYPGPQVRLVAPDGGCVASLAASADQVHVDLEAGRTYRGDTAAGLDTFLSDHLELSGLRLVSEKRPWATRPAHAVLLACLASRWAGLDVAGRGQHHIVLSYALPLALDPWWSEWTMSHPATVVDGQQFVALPAESLVAVDPALDALERHRHLLRAHRSSTVSDHTDLTGFLRDWVEFSELRFRHCVTAAQRDTLRGVLTMSGATVRDVRHASTVIARSVIVRHSRSRTVFDLMAIWHPRDARLRPGILSAVLNLKDAIQRGWRYSLCYGHFGYKDQIVGQARRIDLEQLATHEGQ